MGKWVQGKEERAQINDQEAQTFKARGTFLLFSQDKDLTLYSIEGQKPSNRRWENGRMEGGMVGSCPPSKALLYPQHQVVFFQKLDISHCS